MRLSIIIAAILFSQSGYAGCEASIVTGSHMALSEAEALSGAWEDAKDVCYPGDASKMEVSCEPVAGASGVQGQDSVKCTQSASCTLCGDDLVRKYEAVD